MLKKPRWATGEDAPAIEELQYMDANIAEKTFKTIISVPMLITLSFPLLLVLAFTLFKFGFFPESAAPRAFLALDSTFSGNGNLPFFWGVAIVFFVPWSVFMCKFEDWVSGILGEGHYL